jgi:hypothetical protein
MVVMTDPSPPVRWVDVHEAAAAARVSVTSIRNWYRGPDPEIPSRMERGTDGRQRRVMPLDAVMARAKTARAAGTGGRGKGAASRLPTGKAGRKAAEKAAKRSTKKASGKRTKGAAGRPRAQQAGTAPETVAGEAERTRRRSMAKKAAQSSRRGRTGRTRRERAQSEPPARSEVVLPEGSLPVPVTAWDRMLSQLGNLHELGREMAAAEARASRAETESRFHAERVGELRAELESLRARLQALEEERDEARRDAEEARRQRDAAHTDHERTRIDRDHVLRQLDEARREHQEFTQALQASREMEAGRRRWFS